MSESSDDLRITDHSTKALRYWRQRQWKIRPINCWGRVFNVRTFSIFNCWWGAEYRGFIVLNFGLEWAKREA